MSAKLEVRLFFVMKFNESFCVRGTYELGVRCE